MQKIYSDVTFIFWCFAVWRTTPQCMRMVSAKSEFGLFSVKDSCDSILCLRYHTVQSINENVMSFLWKQWQAIMLWELNLKINTSVHIDTINKVDTWPGEICQEEMTTLNGTISWRQKHIASILHYVKYGYFKGCAVEIWEWKSNFILNLKLNVIIHPCGYQS